MPLAADPVRASHPRIAIIGAGFSGLGLGMKLREAGIESFTIHEKAAALGGTWRDNTYPGAACDTPSFSYCFSFEQKTDWTRKWSPQPEILAYLEHCARKHGLLAKIRFGSEIVGARFDADAALWRLRTKEGEEVEAEVVISAVGQLNRPFVPAIPGLEEFAGERFHSARWNHDVPLEGRSVAVIGNAASAIQFIPQIAPRVGKLLVFQRSANWMVPRLDRAWSEAEKRRFARHPWLARLYRGFIWAMHELRFPVFRRNAWMSRRFVRIAEENLRAHISDPALREKLIPDYPVGGKRILISDDYYQALSRTNVQIVTTGIERVEADAIVTRDGTRHAVDVVILATGFRTTEFLAPMQIEGLRGARLADAWQGGARAYLGMAVPGFPNFFLMYGPNTNLGHNSIIFMLECQIDYVLDRIRTLIAHDLAWLDVRPEALAAFDARVQRELARTAWAATARSWYKDAAGRITNNWSGTTLRYWWATWRSDPRAWRVQRRTAAAEAARAERAAA